MINYPNKIVNCRHGPMLVNVNDIYVGKCLQDYGEWSQPEIFLFEQIVRPGDTVAEVGANIGAHTVALAKAAGPAGAVYAFEPEGHSFQLLCANTALNNLVNVYTRNAVVGSENGKTLFPSLDPSLSNNFGAASMLLNTVQKESVEMCTLDSLRFPRLDFLKVDVEGFEPEVLKGARETILLHRPVCHLEYLSHMAPDHTPVFKDYFRGLNYSLWYFVSPLFNSQNFRGKSENIFEKICSFDMVCVPNEKAWVKGLINVVSGVAHCNDINEWRDIRFKYFG